MPEAPLIEQEVTALHTLEQLAADRSRAESETEQGFHTRRDAESRTFHAALERIKNAAQSEIEATQARYQSVRAEINTRYESERQATEQEYADARKKIVGRYQGGKNVAKKELDEARWQVLAVFEAAKDNAIKQNKEVEAELTAADELLRAVHAEAGLLLPACKRFAGSAPEVPAPDAETPSDNPVQEYHERLNSADEQLAALARLSLPKFLQIQNYIWPFLILALLGAYPLVERLGVLIGLVVDAVIAIVLGVVLWLWLASVARRQVGRLCAPLCRTFAETERLREQSRAWAKANFERRRAEIEDRREQDTREAETKHARAVSGLELARQKETQIAEEKYPALRNEIQQKRDQALKEADEKYPRRVAEIQQLFERASHQRHEAYRTQKETTQRLHDEAWNALAARWENGLTQVAEQVGRVNEISRQAFLDWHHADLEEWQPPTAAPPVLRFGEFLVDLGEIPQGIPSDERLKAMGPTSFTVPALIGFPGQGALLLKSADSGRAAAIELLQAVMLRLLTSVPPGKVRFTIIDPVGLGENFAAFMHLADYHELLVTSRIWTETPHIEQRLADLSEHMENVIQKYLRNEFQSIEEYNVHAGEVAEPFRVLVVANFPANFSEQAARRLASIVSSGARCGVFTLMSVDIKQPLPSGIQLKDLEPYCVNLSWREGRLRWRDGDFGRFPLKLDAPPARETVSRLMHIVGARARDANRVEVPFEFIAPPPEEYWTSDSRAGIDVPLGRAGATKLQHLRLGKGTSQHVLIAGKTGSGKSTLLHALIVNTALRYSPDEVELYLIDFKKGVEFKVYAALELPHARVIAVESEREFGLSVLQRLDLELKNRGDRFRELGVQDLKSYRDLRNGPEPLPRILLIVDEFQEFLVEDDKIARETALLLDRLVRQGRAFGVHVHLGSQTLGGAYSLARSTLGQMAVRIALQCSEADAHLILSEDNSAARLLGRPGEAIYNDANGLVEGNNFFQVVWLSDERREEYLRRIQQLNQERHRPPASQIVFEGNLPAMVGKNHLLNQLLRETGWPEAPQADYAWLGEAIAIKDPTAAIFRPRSGGNLMIVGQYDEGALGMMSTALISLAARHDPTTPAASARFYLFDGSPGDSPNAGKLGRLANVVPHPVQNVTWRGLSGVLKVLSDEVERRRKDESGEAPPIYLFIFDLQRFRELRKQDDDFGGFSRYDEDKPQPPSRLFGEILRDGPPVGVHTIVWCDSLNNLNRTFERQGMREFEILVLFQMSANDSSTLIDSPAASKLGPNRALYFSEEEGRLEKFRPYGPPTDDWLNWVRQRFADRPVPAGSNSRDGQALEAARVAEGAEVPNL